MKFKDKLALVVLSCEKHGKERRKAIAKRIAQSAAVDVSIMGFSGILYYPADLKTGNFYVDAILYIIPALAASLLISRQFKKIETHKQNAITNSSKTCLACAEEIQKLYKKQDDEYYG